VKRALVLTVLLAAGCTSRSPQLVVPDSVESFCPGKPPHGPAIVSILSSVSDAIQPIDVPAEDVLRKHVADAGGAIAHWKTEPLYMPGTARALGVNDNYIDVSEAVITNDLTDPDSRIIYVTVASPQGPKRVALRAYDTRNVCTAQGTPSPS